MAEREGRGSLAEELLRYALRRARQRRGTPTDTGAQATKQPSTQAPPARGEATEAPAGNSSSIIKPK